MAVVGKFPSRKVLFYWLAQYLGAFAAAASVLGVYSGKITFPLFNPLKKKKKKKKQKKTILFRFADAIQYHASTHSNGTLMMNDSMNDPGLAGIFATYPAPWLSTQGGVGDQVIAHLGLQMLIGWSSGVNLLADFGYDAPLALHLCRYR